MEERFKTIIDGLLKHEFTKKETIDRLLFTCSINSSVKIGDRARVDGYHEPDVKVLDIDRDKVLCKLNSGSERWYELYRLVRL